MSKQEYKESSYLASPVAVVLWTVLSLVASYQGNTLLCGFLSMLAVVGLCSFVWGRVCASHITADMSGKVLRTCPGAKMEVKFSVKNDKLLPLVWLELTMPAPERDCVVPCEHFETVRPSPDGMSDIKEAFLRRRFSWIMWHQTVEWTTAFEARRRGIYMPEQITMRTGDGLGLSVRRADITLHDPPVFVVYPRAVEVDVSSFYRNMWSSNAGARGHVEDVTVLRGTREYQNGDPVKGINWRLAARTDELYVNMYDTISPKSVHFLIDCASFCGHEDEFEEALSVVASVMTALDADGVGCGLSMTGSGDKPGMNIIARRSASPIDDCLFAMAGAECSDPEGVFSEDGIAAQASNLGRTYLVCYDPSQSDCAGLFDRTGISAGEVLCSVEPEKNPGMTVRLLSSVTKN